MKNVLRLLVVCGALAPVLLPAQLMLGPGDMPSAGDTVRYRNTTIPGFDGAGTGADHVWDFRSIPVQAEGADTAVSVASTPFLYQLFFNNPILYPQTRADYALRGQAFDFQMLTVEDVYDYYKKDATGFRNVGFGATINGLPASIQRQPVDWIYRFPLTYGDADSSYSTFNINVPTLFTFGQQQMRRNTVDGWGTLYLPADTFEVLRVVSRLERVDTIYVDQFGFGLSLPEPETIEYKWLAQGMDEPVLQVTTVAGVPILSRFFYDPEDISTRIAEARPAEAPLAWPNPVADQLRILTAGTGMLELVAADGRIVRRATVTNAQQGTSMDVSALSPGAYLLRQAGARTGTRVVVAR